MNLKEYQEYVEDSKLTWKDLWEDYKEAIISGYMSAAPQKILDDIGEKGITSYNDFIEKISGLSSNQLRNINNNELKENYHIPL
jgi:hypothetical protein